MSGYDIFDPEYKSDTIQRWEQEHGAKISFIKGGFHNQTEFLISGSTDRTNTDIQDNYKPFQCQGEGVILASF
jgi:hypothetical protein